MHFKMKKMSMRKYRPSLKFFFTCAVKYMCTRTNGGQKIGVIKGTRNIKSPLSSLTKRVSCEHRWNVRTTQKCRPWPRLLMERPIRIIRPCYCIKWVDCPVGALSCFDDVDDVQINVGAKVLIDFHQLMFSVIMRLVRWCLHCNAALSLTETLVSRKSHLWWQLCLCSY